MLVLQRPGPPVRLVWRRLGEARTFAGRHDGLAKGGVEVLVLDDPECIRLMEEFIAAHPALWNEDIGEE